MDVRQLHYFVAVAEERNFTRAAARCHVVQSALSYQIGRLERETGVTLFERTSRSVRLAPAGDVLLPRARHILSEMDRARDELAALAGVLTGRLRIGMIGSAGSAAPVVERALAEFHHRHPAVDITIADTGSATMVEHIRSGETDVAFVGLFPEQLPGDLHHQLISVEPLVAVVPSDHPLGSRGSIGVADLADHGPSVEMRPQSGVRRQVDAVYSRAEVSRRIALELGSSDDVVRYVGLGFGTALVPRSTALDRRGITSLVLTDEQALHPVTLVSRSPRPSTPSARAFGALLDGLTAQSRPC